MTSENATLYDLTGALAKIESELIEAGGELTPDLEARYEEACAALVAKVDRFVEYCAVLDGQAGALDTFAKAVRHKADVLRAHRERLLAYADRTMAERESLEGEHCVLKRRKNPGAVEIRDEDAVAAAMPEACETTFSRKFDKALIRKALKAGNEIPGAALIESHRIVPGVR